MWAISLSLGEQGLFNCFWIFSLAGDIFIFLIQEEKKLRNPGILEIITEVTSVTYKSDSL